MSSLICKPLVLDVEPHPDADRLDIVRPRGTGYVCVSQKGTYLTGDTAIYIGEGAVVPEGLLKDAGFWDEDEPKGMLAGPKGDRVKAIRLRGVVSQGILVRLQCAHAWACARDSLGSLLDALGTGDVSEALGVAKYVPPIPSSMDGKLYHCETIRGYTEIENEKAVPDLLVPGEHVIATEKIHGTCAVYHMDPDGLLNVSSKGQAKKGLAIARNEGNVYWQMVDAYGLYEIMHALRDALVEPDSGDSLALYGEVHGPGIQDLQYGLEEKRLRAFDIRVGDRWLDSDEMERQLVAAHERSRSDRRMVGVVPRIWDGPYDRRILVGAANVRESIIDSGTLREGLVVKAQPERRDPIHGRAIVKMVSDRYLSRKGGTEHE